MLIREHSTVSSAVLDAENGKTYSVTRVSKFPTQSFRSSHGGDFADPAIVSRLFLWYFRSHEKPLDTSSVFIYYKFYFVVASPSSYLT